MAFSDLTKQQILLRSGGQCECTKAGCSHWGRCNRMLDAVYRLLGSTLGFEFHHIQSQAANGADTPANGQFLCIGCHQNTRSFGTNLTR